MSRLLAFGPAASPFTGNAERAAKSLNWQCQITHEFDELVDALVTISPTVLAVTKNRVSPFALGVLPLIEDLGAPLPLLVGVPDDTALVGRSGRLVLACRLRSSPETVAEGLLAGVEQAKPDDTGPYFAVSDYLVVARALGETASLSFRFAGPTDAVIEVVEGIPSKVIFENLEGAEALRSIAPLFPCSSSVSHRSTGARQADDVRVPAISFDKGPNASGETGMSDGSSEPSHARSGRETRDNSSLRSETQPLDHLLTAIRTEIAPRPAEDNDATVTQQAQFQPRFNRAMELTLARDYRSALEIFERLARERPDDRRVQFNLKRLRDRL